MPPYNPDQMYGNPEPFTVSANDFDVTIPNLQGYMVNGATVDGMARHAGNGTWNPMMQAFQQYMQNLQAWQNGQYLTIVRGG